MLSDLFKPASQDDIDQLIADYPLGQLVSCDSDQFITSALPLLLERKASDEAFLRGHFDRHNPHLEWLRRNPRALALFMGVHGYISPSLRRTRRIAPTWNYATVRCEVEVHFDESAAATREALERLVTHMEAGREEAWSIDEMGERYAGQARGVIAFRARVLSVDAAYKLGQNERPENFSGIVGGLRRVHGGALAAAMEHACAMGKARDGD